MEMKRKVGAIVIAGLVVAGATACSGASGNTTTDAGGGSSQTPTSAGAEATPTFSSSYIGYLDLTTGEISTTEILPSGSAIDVSTDGGRIAYTADGVVSIADLERQGPRGNPR